MKKHWTVALSTTVFCFLGLAGLAGACPPRAEADGPQDGKSGCAARLAAMGTASADQAPGGGCRGKCDPATCDPATCDQRKCAGACGGAVALNLGGSSRFFGFTAIAMIVTAGALALMKQHVAGSVARPE